MPPTPVERIRYIYDGGALFVYNYFRTYDPSTGRYLESDPIGLGGGLNTYGYVGGNPLSLSDAFGLLPEDYRAADEILRDYASQKGIRVPDRIGIGLPPISDAIGASGHTYPSWRREEGDPGFYVTDDYFDRCINDDEARRLLNTYIHENMHFNHSRWEEFLLTRFQKDQLEGSGNRIGDRIHDRVYRDARSIANQLFPKFNELKRRKIADYFDSVGKDDIEAGCECYDYYSN